jgi:hypothetical protein
MIGACACPHKGVAPSSLPYIRRTIASLGRPLVAPSTTRSDASRFVSHVLRPSPEGTDIPRLMVFDLEPCTIPYEQVR